MEEHQATLRADSGASNLTFGYSQYIYENDETDLDLYGETDGFYVHASDGNDDEYGGDDGGGGDNGGDGGGGYCSDDDKENTQGGSDNAGESRSQAAPRRVLGYAVEYWLDHIQKIPEFDADILELCKKTLT